MPKRVDHDERRGQIVEALWRITVRGGLSAASFREVAAEAGVSVRLVQYYFGTKAELLHAANRQVAERATSRIMRRMAALGADAEPRQIVHAVVNEFLPTDRQSREAMLLFFAFYTAQMTDPTLARTEASSVPRGLAALIAGQIRRAQASGDAPADLDPEREGAFLTAAIPGLASGVLVNYITAGEAATILDYAVDRLFSLRPSASAAQVQKIRGARKRRLPRNRRR
jgi:TetR/AcrR family transcriptional regulator, transcriptional repressor of bet genes